MSAPTPLRQDFDAPQVRGLARKTKDGPQARRLLALAAIYDGATRTEAAKIGGVGLQIIRDWVLRFNARGPDGLLDWQVDRTAVQAQRHSAAGHRRHDREWPDPGGAWRGALAADSIWRNGSSRNSASQSPSRRSAGSCEPWATANYRPDRVTMRKPRARSRILKKLPRAPGGNCAQEGA